MSPIRSSTKPGHHLLVIVIVFMILLVAAFIVRTAALRAEAQRGLAVGAPARSYVLLRSGPPFAALACGSTSIHQSATACGGGATSVSGS